MGPCDTRRRGHGQPRGAEPRSDSPAPQPVAIAIQRTLRPTDRLTRIGRRWWSACRSRSRPPVTRTVPPGREEIGQRFSPVASHASGHRRRDHFGHRGRAGHAVTQVAIRTVDCASRPADRAGFHQADGSGFRHTNADSTRQKGRETGRKTRRKIERVRDSHTRGRCHQYSPKHSVQYPFRDFRNHAETLWKLGLQLPGRTREGSRRTMLGQGQLLHTRHLRPRLR